MSLCGIKPTKWSVRPAKTQISLGIRPFWSESWLSAWRRIGTLATHWAHNEDSDQSGLMSSLIKHWNLTTITVRSATNNFLRTIKCWPSICQIKRICCLLISCYWQLTNLLKLKIPRGWKYFHFLWFGWLRQNEKLFASVQTMNCCKWYFTCSSYTLSTQRRFLSVWDDAQTDLSLCWGRARTHKSFCWFWHAAAQAIYSNKIKKAHLFI